MSRAGFRLGHVGALAYLMAGIGLAVPAMATATAPAQEDSTKAWSVILDPQQPLALRRQALAGLEQDARDGDQGELYLLGSLYQMGPRASGAPVPQDLEKATLYLGNAALRGSLLAMAKMAEIDLATRKYREAMIWAQVFAHYAMLLPDGERPPEGYTAELVQRILDKLGRSSIPQVMPDVADFIAQHDAGIRAGTSSHFGGKAPRPKPNERPVVTPEGRFAARSGFADYLLAFRPDGSVAHAWLLDAVPDPALGETLRHYVREMTLPAESADAGDRLRYSWLPAMFDDHRYRAAPGASRHRP
jgi:hypothetical protein